MIYCLRWQRKFIFTFALRSHLTAFECFSEWSEREEIFFFYNFTYTEKILAAETKNIFFFFLLFSILSFAQLQGFKVAKISLHDSYNPDALFEKVFFSLFTQHLKSRFCAKWRSMEISYFSDIKTLQQTVAYRCRFPYQSHTILFSRSQ